MENAYYLREKRRLTEMRDKAEAIKCHCVARKWQRELDKLEEERNA